MLCPRFKSILTLLVFISFVCSCSQDEGYSPIQIHTESDDAEVFQDDTVRISIFLNDSDLPADGILKIGNPKGGTLLVLDPNNTPNNPFDDVLEYQANQNFEGLDTFTYSICEPSTPASCSTSSINITVKARSFVNFDLSNMPFDKLSDYNFFQGSLSELTPSYKVIPYELNSSLFSDYAKKERFIWLPKGTQATLKADFEPLEFPIGSMLIKNFYYENVAPDNSKKLIETRLMYLTENGWQFAEYVWNTDQTDAFYDDKGSFKSITWTQEGESKTVNYRIPSQSECFTCHNSYGTPLPIGPKPQNLNKSINLGTAVTNQLTYFMSEGILKDDTVSNIVSTVDWQDESKSLELRARSYLDINCAHCHSSQSYCDYRPVRFAFNETQQLANLGVCVDADEPVSPYEEIVKPGQSEKSLLLFRLKTLQEQYRMPLLGRSLQHEEGVELIETWINSLNQNCE